MSFAIIAMTVDAFGALLLAATIFYCIKLNRRIRDLQDSKSELAQLIEQFGQCTQRAESGVTELKTASKKVWETMQMRMDKANFLADDLSFMIEKASKMADQLELGISASRGKIERPEAAAPRQSMRAAPQSVPPANEFMPATSTRNDQQKPSSLETVLDRMAKRTSEPALNPTGDAKKPMVVPRVRSKAEQDLMNALNPNKANKQ